MLEKIVYEAKIIQEYLVEHRRFLHENAEAGMDLPVTADYVEKELSEMGYKPERICPSCIVAVLEGKKPGKTVLLRADMDALPFAEKNDEPFRSKTPNMHACGHDMHTAMLLGAAKILKDHESELEGTVKFMFQPGEEIFKGAAAMIEAGVLSDPDVDMAMMIHVGTGLPVPDGIFSKPVKGPFSATSDRFSITVNGKGGHGALPERSVDPLIPAATILLGLQEINTREISSLDPVVITVGKIEGGSAPNIIPDSVSMEGTIRTFSNKLRDVVKKRIDEVSRGIAIAYRSGADVTFDSGCPSVVIDEEGAEVFMEAVTEMFGEDSLFPVDSRIPASEDFAFITENVPGIMVIMSAGYTKDGYFYPPHHPGVKFSENPLYKGAAAYAGFALKWLSKHGSSK